MLYRYAGFVADTHAARPASPESRNALEWRRTHQECREAKLIWTTCHRHERLLEARQTQELFPYLFASTASATEPVRPLAGCRTHGQLHCVQAYHDRRHQPAKSLSLRRRTPAGVRNPPLTAAPPPEPTITASCPSTQLPTARAYLVASGPPLSLQGS